MRQVQCTACSAQLELTSEILAAAATEVTRFVCGGCGASQEAAYVKGRSTGARLWHATLLNSEPLKTPFVIEGAGPQNIEKATR